MTRQKNSKKDRTPIYVAVIGFLGTLLAAVIGYMGTQAQNNRPIINTQTAVSQLAASQTVVVEKSVLSTHTPSPTGPSIQSTAAITQETSTPANSDQQRATLYMSSQKTIDHVLINCGPHGYSSYNPFVEFTDDLKVIQEAQYGPSSGRFIQFDQVSSIDFIAMSEEEIRVINENSTYRDWIRKVNVTFWDHTMIENIYLLETCTYQAAHEKGITQDLDLQKIAFQNE